jgi:hemerythrin-like metal-binding protein
VRGTRATGTDPSGLDSRRSELGDVMPLITWTSRLETGIGIIDSQHKRLVEIINEFHEAAQAGRSEEILGAIFDELVAYTETHFGVEEKLMANHEYEAIEEHRGEHKRFTDQIKMDRYNFSVGAWSYDKRLIDYLRGWLVNHIAASDQAYVPTLKRAGVE